MSLLTRRHILTARVADQHFISSAVVLALPERCKVVAARLADMNGVEVHAHGESRIVITIEGSTSGVLGEILTTISLMDGVLAANMVFEHAEPEEARS